MTKPEQLKALAKKMKPNHLKMAKSKSEGNSNATAYRDAGYKGKDANALGCQLALTNPIIQQYADLAKEIQAESAQSKGIATLEQKTALLWKIAQHNAGIAQNDTDEGEGDSEEIKMVDAKAAISAMAELNKMSGDLASIKTESKHSFTDASKDELERKLAQLQSQL